MKKIFYDIMTLSVAAVLTMSCDEREAGDTTAPGQITNVSFTPTYGGGYFKYDIPEDDDFLYVRADYVIDSGTEVSKTASTYVDSLFIEGFGQSKEYEVKLFSVDRNENASAPVVMKVTPLESNTNMVAGTIKVRPGFSAVIAEWTNELESNIEVFVKLDDGNKTVEKVTSSNSAKGYFLIQNLMNTEYNVSVYTRDQYGNVSAEIDCGKLSPLKDGKIDKSRWSFLANQYLYGSHWNYDSDPNPEKQTPYPEYMGSFTKDSLMNAPASAYEGRIEKFWDDILFTRNPENLNIFNTGQWGYPYSYFIDLGRFVRGSRVRYHQRTNDAYGNENVQEFQVWISDDKNPADGIGDWELVSTYKIIKPADQYEADLEAEAGHEFILYPSETKYTKPFRYLRFKAIRGFTDRMVSVGSEITLYGLDEGE